MYSKGRSVGKGGALRYLDGMFPRSVTKMLRTPNFVVIVLTLFVTVFSVKEADVPGHAAP